MKDNNGDKPSRAIGNLNGGWQLLFKLALATYPFVVGGCAWIFQVLREHDNRLTKVEATTFSVDYRSQLVMDIGVLKDGAISRDRRLDQIERKLDEVLKEVRR